MKTTLEIPDELYRAVKAKAAIEGRRVTAVVIEGLRLAIDGPTKSEKRVELPIIKAKKGAEPLLGRKDLHVLADANLGGGPEARLAVFQSLDQAVHPAGVGFMGRGEGGAHIGSSACKSDGTTKPLQLDSHPLAKYASEVWLRTS